MTCPKCHQRLSDHGTACSVMIGTLPTVDDINAMMAATCSVPTWTQWGPLRPCGRLMPCATHPIEELSGCNECGHPPCDCLAKRSHTSLQ